MSEIAGFSNILLNVVDSGRGVSHPALYQSDAKVGSTLQGDRRAVWSVNHGYGILQGAHWAYTAGNRLLRQWLPWFQRSVATELGQYFQLFTLELGVGDELGIPNSCCT